MVSISKKCEEHVLAITTGEEGTCRALVDRLKEGAIVVAFHVTNTFIDELPRYHWRKT